jgi:phage N-6-adenine-methyltransferase
VNQIATLETSNLAQFSISELVRIGRDAIAHAGSFSELRAIAAKAEALAAFQKAIGAATDAVNAAAEIRIRAQRRMGEELAKAELAKGAPGNQYIGPVPEEDRSNVTLAGIGISKNQSSRYQHLAGIEEDTFDAVVEAHKRAGEPISTASVARVADAIEELPADAREELVTRVDVEIIDLAKTIRHHRTQGTGHVEWYTPARYVEAARTVMGGIDLDPASSEIANRTVQAQQFYTVEDDGLAQPWCGRLWLNPPYSQPWIAQFLAKLVAETEKGAVRQAIALTHNYTDTAWFQATAPAAAAVCFTRGRIAFVNPDTSVGASPTQGQAFFYFGPNAQTFAEVFSPIGWVVLGRGVTAGMSPACNTDRQSF